MGADKTGIEMRQNLSSGGCGGAYTVESAGYYRYLHSNILTLVFNVSVLFIFNISTTMLCLED